MTGTGLAEAVLSRFRAGSDVWRWHVYGAELRAAVDVLRSRLRTADPAEVLDVVRAITASITIGWADRAKHLGLGAARYHALG